MAKIALNVDEFEKLMKAYQEILSPKRYYVVTDGVETFIFVPIKTSRHLHYYEVKARGENYEKLRAMLEQRGFVVVLGEVTFLPG